jgi:preprotein translocase subunit SecD
MRLERATGWAAIIEAFVTTTIPGALLLLGDWRAVSGAITVAAGLLTLVLVALLGARSLARSRVCPSHANQPPARGATRAVP